MTHNELLSDRNASEGLQVLLVYANDVSNNVFVPLTLMSFFIIVFLGSYFATKRSGTKGDMAGSFAVASYVMTIIEFVMSLIPGLITPLYVVIAFSTSLLGTIWLFTSKDR